MLSSRIVGDNFSFNGWVGKPGKNKKRGVSKETPSFFLRGSQTDIPSLVVLVEIVVYDLRLSRLRINPCGDCRLDFIGQIVPQDFPNLRNHILIEIVKIYFKAHGFEKIIVYLAGEPTFTFSHLMAGESRRSPQLVKVERVRFERTPASLDKFKMRP